MDHPFKTLLYDLLVEPLLRLLQRMSGSSAITEFSRGSEVITEPHAGGAWQLSCGIGLPVLGILIVLFAIGTDAALLVGALAFLLTTAGLTLLSSWSKFRRQHIQR
jgi:hypothetical protein